MTTTNRTPKFDQTEILRRIGLCTDCGDNHAAPGLERCLPCTEARARAIVADFRTPLAAVKEVA